MRYMLFAGDLYSTRGGFLDYKGSYGTEGEAGFEFYLRRKEEGWNWCQVVDTYIMQIVWETYSVDDVVT
jgi:hypothetical protein